jgi:ribonucleases P/MRP protein subunit RPP40
VPQETVLGPLLFILYINDIAQCVLSSNVLLFADDTLVTISGDTTEEVSRKLNEDLALLSNWLNCNKLKLNVDKTKCMIITNKKIQKDEIMMNIGGKMIGRVTKIKYLGVFLDDALKLDEHVDYICKKMGRKYGFMKRVSKN